MSFDPQDSLELSLVYAPRLYPPILSVSRLLTFDVLDPLWRLPGVCLALAFEVPLIRSCELYIDMVLWYIHLTNLCHGCRRRPHFIFHSSWTLFHPVRALLTQDHHISSLDNVNQICHQVRYTHPRLNWTNQPANEPISQLTSYQTSK